MGVVAIHYAPSMGTRYNHRSAHVLQSNAVRLRRAVDVARLTRKREAGSSAAIQLGAFAVPAFLLDGRGRVLELNDAATQLIAGRAVSLDFNNMLRLGDAALSERVAAAAGQIAWRTWLLERDAVRTQLAGAGIALASWGPDEPIAAPVEALAAAR